MKKPHIKKEDLKQFFPELYTWVYGYDTPKPPKVAWYKKLRILYTWLPFTINTWLNSFNYWWLCRQANIKYAKTRIHRHLVPIKQHRLALITGAQLVSYNKKAVKNGLKKIKYNKLKHIAYYTTDLLSVKKTSINDLYTLHTVTN